MLTYDFSKRGNVPLYEYLYKMIREDIERGRIKKDEKLPSKRGLAEHLKVSVVTVENAYSQLAAEGYIYSRERSGYYACAAEAPRAAEVKTTAPKNVTEEETYIDLYSDSAPPDAFPTSVWGRLMRREISERAEALFSRTSQKGAEELRSAIAEHLYKEKGMSVSPENIIIGSGTQNLFELIALLLGRETLWAIENPGYKKLSLILACLGVKFVPVICDGGGMVISKMAKSGAKAVHLSPSHHFPTGAVMPASRRAEALLWAESAGGYIVEDDYDSEFRFVGRPIAPLSQMDKGGRVIYLNTFTKSIAPSLRIAYMVLPDRLLEVFEKKLAFHSCPVPAFEQYTLARFISEGYFSKHLQRLKTRSLARRNAVIKTIDESMLAKYAHISEENSGLHFLLRLDTKRKDGEIKKDALSRGVRVSFLSDFTYGEEKRFEHTLLINYSDLDIADLERALGELARII